MTEAAAFRRSPQPQLNKSGNSERLIGSDNQHAVAPQGVNDTSDMNRDAGKDTARHLSPPAPSQDDPAATTDSLYDLPEDYDDLELDPHTLVATSKKALDDGKPPLGNSGIRERRGTEASTGGRLQPGGTRIGLQRTNSIKVKLERTNRKGRYILTADDPEIREILRRGIEREEAEANNNSKSRTRLRDLVFTRQFTTFDRQNPASSESPFFGFFTLFWIAMVLIFIQVSMHNLRDYGSILGRNQIMKMMFSRDVLVLGLTDGVMFLLCIEGYFLQVLVKKGYIDWNRTGWILQNVWQSAYLASLVGWTYFRDWPWTHTMFAVLHGLVFIMKQHSWSFYNGYLSGVYKRRAVLIDKLKQLEAMEPINSSPTSPVASDKWTTGSELNEWNVKTLSLLNRRNSLTLRTSTDVSAEKSDVASVASAIESGSSLTTDQLQTFNRVIHAEIASLTDDLRGKSSPNTAAYPANLTLTNLAEFICLPTLVYELAYPRQEKTNWWYVLEKTTATFGVLGVMMVISQAFIYPPVTTALALKNAGLTLSERWQYFPFLVSDLIFPLLIEQLLTWYLIWECILNVLAEVTCFADRGFYGAWWNSQTWDQYARDWNRPVHAFLLRHVYHSSISALRVNRYQATFITFALSALVHEMVMALLFNKVRGYLFCMQLLQLPLVQLSRSKMLRGRAVLGNAIFWIGLFVGPSVLTGLYLVI